MTGKIISESIGLMSKMYYLVIDNDKRHFR